MSRARVLVLLVVIGAGALTGAILHFGVIAVLVPVVIVVILVGGIFAFALNTGQYVGATESAGKAIDRFIAAVCGARRGGSDDWRAWLRSGHDARRR